LKILEGEIQDYHWSQLVGVSHVDLWPERTAVGVQAQFICFDLLPAVLLTVILHLVWSWFHWEDLIRLVGIHNDGVGFVEL
jgi:hypothetical protein